MIDGSVYSTSVCDHAAWLSRRLDVPLVLAHVIGRRDVELLGQGENNELMQKLKEVDGHRSELLEAIGEQILADAAERALSAGAPAVHRRLRRGDLLDALAELEVDSRCIVIGKRGAAADFAKLHLGSNIERVVRASRVHVMVASRAFVPIKRFLVAYDGGPTSVKALKLISRSPVYDHLEPHILTVTNDEAEGRKALIAAEELLNWSGKVVTTVASGAPEKAIADYVENRAVDLVVMGAYGHSRVRNLLVGSTTSQMMQSCKIPIVIVR
ncbi:UspA-related nucleotide-binding protein [Stappia sp. 22II-S9-Z10]|nr:UspA-related nucleotide-binding protein [Stappia sp. 22II-S9-Z10]